MGEIDLETILNIAGDEKIAKNATSFTDLLREFDHVISGADKAINLLNKLERSPLVSTMLRAGWKKSGIEIGPLVQEAGIVPKTPVHEQVLRNINGLDEQQLKQLMERLIELDKKKEEEDEKNRLKKLEGEKDAKAND
jgi:hypothetical protein